MPPYHLYPLSACPGEPALAVWPSRHRGHSLGYSREHMSVRNQGPRDRATLWDTHVHSHVLGDTVTHTQVHTDTLQDTQEQTSEDTATQVSQTHTRTHTCTAQVTEQQAHIGTHKCMLLGTWRNSHPQKYTDTHGDTCRPPVRYRHQNRHTHTHTWFLHEKPEPLRPGNNNSPAGGLSGRPSVPPWVVKGAPERGPWAGRRSG